MRRHGESVSTRGPTRMHSESASTRSVCGISAEALPSPIRTVLQRERFDRHNFAEGKTLAPQRECFDTHDLRRGFTFILQRCACKMLPRTLIRRRRHGESVILKKGLFHATLLYARPLLAATAIVLELRLSKCRSLNWQGHIHREAALPSKTHFAQHSARLGRGFPETTRPAS